LAAQINKLKAQDAEVTEVKQKLAKQMDKLDEAEEFGHKEVTESETLDRKVEKKIKADKKAEEELESKYELEQEKKEEAAEKREAQSGAT